jgi:hypothetical protein
MVIRGLAIPEGVPVKDQKNGWLWVFLFLLEVISVFVAIYGIFGLVVKKPRCRSAFPLL